MNPAWQNNVSVPQEAEIVEKVMESDTVFTLRLRFTDPEIQENYHFMPGQFNMVYLFGCGEVAISIVSDPETDALYDHTIRVIGRITAGLEKLKKGDRIGIRGPFGKGWPVERLPGKDIVLITGGLGCASTAASIKYIMQRHSIYRSIHILQGIKHSRDMIFEKRFADWANVSNTHVYIAADQSDPDWPHDTGRVTDSITSLSLQPNNTIAMLCGPTAMITVAAATLHNMEIPKTDMYVCMERNMHCGYGHCGHCQYGGLFICKDGPIFPFPVVEPLYHQAGF